MHRRNDAWKSGVAFFKQPIWFARSGNIEIRPHCQAVFRIWPAAVALVNDRIVGSDEEAVMRRPPDIRARCVRPGLASPPLAQVLPSKPIRVIVPYPPGDAVDILSASSAEISSVRAADDVE